MVRHHFVRRACPVCGATKIVRDYERWCTRPPRCEVCGADGREVVEVLVP